jgi:(2R)-3-sulfolactate dehydrogenase (NADP+)
MTSSSASADPAAVPAPTRRLGLAELEDLCRAAVRAAGGSGEVADSLASAAVSAERRGKSALGAAHLVDYLAGLREGRIAPDARPRVTVTRRAVVAVDADGGTAQLAFDAAQDALVAAARDCGVAILSVHDAFTAGELGDYATRLADAGLVAITGANSPALMTVHGADREVTGTNPIAFALPHPDGPRMFDQAASETAWVKIRDAADRGSSIPEGWALDPEGEPTTDARAAIAGALLPFGGVKGGNIALMIEMLAALSGGAFSLDAAPFDSGDASPSLGMFAIAIDPTAFADDYPQRAEEHLRRLHEEHGVDFGRRRAEVTEVEMPLALLDELTGTGSPAPAAAALSEER